MTIYIMDWAVPFHFRYAYGDSAHSGSGPRRRSGGSHCSINADGHTCKQD